MRRLSLKVSAVPLLFVVLIATFILGREELSQSPDPPHGDNFKISCSVCHSTKGWKLDREIYSFNHDTTALPLIGQHKETDCKLCHPSLIFSEANTECSSCHTDVHESTVGYSCERCHTPHSWLVQNITQIHQLSRFPLIGVHARIDCYECHRTETFLRFEVLGTDCYSCHIDDYASTTLPNHQSAGFSTNCIDCHNIFADDWTGTGFNHDFFPLTLGHDIDNCSQCHTDGNFSALPTECSACHQDNYDATTNPVHASLGFSTNCTECHTIDPGWKPAKYTQHDALSFPIYSGKHRNEWSNCTDCHKNPASYKEFTCLECHEHNQNDMDDKHSGMQDYFYVSSSCLTCHPDGTVIEN